MEMQKLTKGSPPPTHKNKKTFKYIKMYTDIYTVI